LRNKVLALLAVTAILSSNTSWAGTPAHTTKRVTAKKTSAKHKKVKAKKGSWKTRGQKQIADDRTREIQTALVREGYMEGEPTGVMDGETKSALAKLQADNGWQTKIVPDSRALIKLGLGPDQSKVINPDTAALASPVTTSTVEGVGNQH
jgi:peptidoglycan hydrolase-like protein with peptidoglycan-binding domain